LAAVMPNWRAKDGQDERFEPELILLLSRAPCRNISCRRCIYAEYVPNRHQLLYLRCVEFVVEIAASLALVGIVMAFEVMTGPTVSTVKQ
jgi:hypothetical protein